MLLCLVEWILMQMWMVDEGKESESESKTESETESEEDGMEENEEESKEEVEMCDELEVG